MSKIATPKMNEQTEVKMFDENEIKEFQKNDSLCQAIAKIISFPEKDKDTSGCA